MDNKNYFVYIDDIENENQKLVFNTEERTLLISEMVLIFFLPCLVSWKNFHEGEVGKDGRVVAIWHMETEK